jgi:hypothetical protein
MEPSQNASGFEIVPSVLARTEIARIAEVLQSESIDHSRAGARHLMPHPVVDRVAHDPRLVAIASRFLAPAAIPFRATLFDKSPDNNWLVVWHQDTAVAAAGTS